MSHIIKFAGRKLSGAINQNLLWRSGNVYLMDNHRAALWCWKDQIDLSTRPHNLLHIDRHYDALGANLQQHIAALPSLADLTIHQYLAAKLPLNGEPAYLFRWDNYLSIYLDQFSKQLRQLICLTHKEGDRPLFANIYEPNDYQLPSMLECWLEGDNWIVNVDLDYFFCDGPDDTFVRLVSDEYIEQSFLALRRAMAAGKVAVVTICLTPTYCTPGWAETLAISKRIFAILGEIHPDI